MQLKIDVDREAIARYGLNVAQVREALKIGIGGSTATTIVDGRRRYPVVVCLDAADRSTPEGVGSTLIATSSGGTDTLSQVARIATFEEPEAINHENGRRNAVVQSNVRGRDLGGFVNDVRAAVQATVRIAGRSVRRLNSSRCLV